MKPFARFLLPLLAASFPLAAGRIDVSSQNLAWVHPGAWVEIQFGVWNYGWNNPGYSPYPTQIGLQIIGQTPPVPAEASPDSTALYFPGLLFEGWLRSLDGTVAVPLYDSKGNRKLLASPGTFSTGGDSAIDVAVMAASVSMSESTSRALFGENIDNYDSGARILLHNIGDGFALGIGPDYTVRYAVSEPGIGGTGPVETSGITGLVMVENPEPSTWLTLPGALVVLGLVLRRRGVRGRQPLPDGRGSEAQ